jgi:Mce-associated membrane protein
MTVPSPGAVPRRANVIVAFALVVTIAAAVLSVLGVIKLTRSSGSAGSSTNASVAAEATTAMTEGGQIAVDFTSFDYRTLSQDYKQTAAHATPTFAKTYLQQSRLVAKFVKKAKAISTSSVVATGLVAFNPTAGTATVNVALNDTTKNIKSPAGAVQYYRMSVELVKQNGVWLAQGVTPV